MRITINVGDLQPAQWEWLLRETERPWQFKPDQIRVCVIFEAPEPHSLIEQAHRELPVHAWLGLIKQLRWIGRNAEALLTPDALPE